MKSVIRFCIFLLFSAVSLVHAQKLNSDFFQPGGYSVQPSFSNVSNAGFNNPSFLSRCSGISAGLSYQYGSRIEKPYDGFIGKSLVNGLPYSAAFAYQTGDFHVAAAISQRYNLTLESTGGVGIYIKNPDGTSKAVNVSIDGDVHDYSVLSSYRIGGLPEGNSLSLGLRLSLGTLKYYSHYDAVLPLQGLKFTMNSMTFALGADYKLAFNKGDLTLGAYYEKGHDFQGDVQIEQQGSLNHTAKIDASTPDALGLNLMLNLSKVQITADMSQMFWHLVYQSYKNNLDFSLGVNYRAADILSVSLGVLMTNLQYVNNYYSDQPENNALFLTLGTDVILGNYTLGFSVSDSHLTSAETRKQTLGRLTLGCQF